MPRLPGGDHLDAVRALEKAGFHIRRQGKQVVLTNGTWIVVIPRNNPINAMTPAALRSGLTGGGSIGPRGRPRTETVGSRAGVYRTRGMC